MLKLKVKITYFQPFRVIPWIKEDDRNSDRNYLRGGTFARWHKDKKDDIHGKPYITGTLLRSALFTEIEKIKIHHSDFIHCCNAIDRTEGKHQPSFLRKRPVYTENKNIQACNKCPLCLIMGRGDDRGEDLKKKKHYNGKHYQNWTVHFSNFDTQATFYWKDIVQKRILNRVDQTCGKAKDFFKVCEVDHIACPTLNGIIRINDEKLSQEEISKIKQLIAVGLAQIESLAGGICRIDITNQNHDDLIKSFFETKPSKILQPNLKESGEERFELAKLELLAEYLTQSFDANQKEQQLRRLADAIRDLRKYSPDYLKDLPKGKKGGRTSIWNKKVADDFTLRDCLKNQKIPNELWRQFCEGLGREVYKISKNISNRSDAKPRLLGETEYAGLPLRKEDEKEYSPTYQNQESLPKTKWIISGELQAITPFYIGHVNKTSHTRSTIFLNMNGQFCIPRSTLRGALRRDLRLVFGDSCNTPVGSRVCYCQVCQIMRCIKFEDALSDVDSPPEVRHRIRLNCHTGVVEEGALFDMETGFQGMIFPFRLYYESKNEIMSQHLYEVLNNWTNGQAFFGGEAGTGFGRFKLLNNEVFLWEIDGEEEDYLQYLFSRGYKGIETDEIKKVADPIKWKTLFTKLEIPPEKIPLTQLNYTLTIDSPLISRDPIAAMLDNRNPDAVMVKKTILVYEQDSSTHKNVPKEVPKYFIKSETIRGLLRSIISRTEIKLEDGKKERIFNLDHEDCDCLQCRLFGNVHQQGILRFEDAEITNKNVSDCCIDHVAIDRFTGGGVEKMKFNDYPLSASPKNCLNLKGSIWITSALKDSEKEALSKALSELKYGYASLGGLSAIGYGRVKELTLEENDIIQLTEITESNLNSQSRLSLKPDVKKELSNNHFYYPHYFIKPAPKEVVRESRLISHVQGHDTEGEFLLTGKIKCRLQTLGPLFIANNDKGDDYFELQHNNPGHLNYAFFRINDHIAIPGASIRGMISSVFETLTHSCFRVMDDKKYLTRRVIPESETTQKRKSGRYQVEESDPDLFPGRVQKKGNKYKIEKMDEIVRLPIYDNFSLVERIREYHYSEECASYVPSVKKAIDYNRMLAQAADSNREFLYNHPEAKSILQGKKEVYYILHKQESKNRGKTKEINPNARYACLTDENTPGSRKGFIKFTGPDMVTVNKELKSKIAPIYDPEWEKDIPDWERSNQESNHKYSFILHNEIEMRSSQKKKYPRPVFICKKNGVEYRMQKRCERIFDFTKEEEKDKEIVIPQKVVSQYNAILKDNKENTETIPGLFNSKMVNKELEDGDLVYFKYKEGKVTELTPVAISRKTDNKPMGKRFPKISINGKMKPNDSLRSCSHTCTEDCDDCPNLCESVKDYFKPHPDGLCPACHLFGTTFYKSRLSFGLAWLENNAKWYISNDFQQKDSKKEKGGKLTLPLLERPRPTWSMPNNNAEVPGRKFYVHHPWSVENIKNNQGNQKDISLKPDSDAIKIKENNRTIEPLGKDNVFNFEISFNNLRDWELGLLLYAIELEDHLAHKLGMAKAFGMGSVKIEIKNLLIKGSINDISKAELIKKGFKKLGIDSLEKDDLSEYLHIKQLREILWFSDKPVGTIEYPKLENKTNSRIPSYTDFVQEKDHETGFKNPKYQNLKSRLHILQNPWNAWWKNEE
ncbi:protein containing DUF324 [Candidatus Magnetomorum sp. HK-1]|nr:protein containing DUF324 [Candidatus Magnetomorum sp. HK-1]